MELLPEHPQPRVSVKRDTGSGSFVRFETSSHPETDDEIQAWILDLFDWEIDGVCGSKLHTPPGSVSNLLDKEGLLPDEKIQAGNFSHSCRRCIVSQNTYHTLQAECLMLNGEYRYSAIGLESIIMGLNGQFHWLNGTIRSPNCQKSDANEWHLLNQPNVKVNTSDLKKFGFTVPAICMDNYGEYQGWHLTLDEKIANDNGRLKLVTPIGLLTIPLFTDYHVSSVAMAMFMDIQHHRSTFQSEDIESRVRSFSQSQRFAQSSKQPLAESLDLKAAALISLMWIRFCRTDTVADLVEYSRICEAINHRLRNEPQPSHELKVLLDHYREMPSHLKAHANTLIQAVNDGRPYTTEAIHILQMVQEVVAKDDESKSFYELELCKMLMFRFDVTSNREDLRTACALAETLCATFVEDDDRKATSLIVFAKCKWEEDLLSDEQKNEQAIINALQKAEQCSTGLNRYHVRQNLFTYRCQNLCTLEAFDCIGLHRELEWLNRMPADFAAKGQKMTLLDEVAYWHNKARIWCLLAQAKAEDSSLIDEAINCAEKSFSICKAARGMQGSRGELFPPILETYAQALAIRFKISYASDDLHQIIEVYQEAVDTCGSLYKRRAYILRSLAEHQLLWHERKRVQGNVDQILLDAFQNAKEAYDSSSEHSNARALCANTLAMALGRRHQVSGDLSLLNEAIQIATNSLATLSDSDVAHTFLEATKCELLFQRFLLQQSIDLYNEAMGVARQHSRRSPFKTIDGPRQVIQIVRLAVKAFEKKFEVLQEDFPSEDISFIRQQCDQIFNLNRTFTRHRAEVGIMLGLLCCMSNEWAAAKKVLEKTTNLIKRLINRSLSRSDQEWCLKHLSKGLPTIASFVALYAAKDDGLSTEEAVLSSLQHLESSRGILARLVFQSKLNLELFQSMDEKAAEEYENLLNRLNSLEAFTSVHGDQALSKHENITRGNAIHQRAKITKRISELEDALGANAENMNFDVLKSLVGKSALVQVIANSGTTIALLVTGAGLRQIELPELKALDIEKNLDRLYGNCRLSKATPLQVYQAGQELREILKWLWDKAVKLILCELGYYPQPNRQYRNRLPRLWWSASGVMSKFPFHAAGEGASKKENVYDYAVCSFTPSMMALKMARDCTAPLENVFDDGILAVSMPTTPGRGWVPLRTEEELKSIKEAAGLVPTCLTNPEKHAVVERINEYGIIHFICHGTSIADNPSFNALILGHQEASAAEHLTVKELSNINRGKAQIAYLAACSTAENSSYELLDESIHLASAFQLVGFPHVIAALWEAKDRGAILLAGLFYQKLNEGVAESNTFESNHDIVAYALHDALCQVRTNHNSRNPLNWVPFVHTGA
ncbi:MAG: hypothetical protein LQ351_006388 [Letrouitia transgressa]|nr:MAG: hypothetical protein LQ351_006388 [Letrouitia transgressa]